MPIDTISGRVFREAAIPGLTDAGTIQQPASNTAPAKTFPNLTPAESAANAKAAGAPATASSSANPLTGVAGGALDKTAFLKLLVQEMTNQDPLKPADNTQFIAQLAQFSTLEQMQNMNTGFTNLTNSFQASQATGLLGATIHAVDSATGNPVDGVVDKILLSSSGTAQVDVNGTAVNLSDILSIASSPAAAAASNAGSTPASTSGAALPGTIVPPPADSTTGTATTGTGA